MIESKALDILTCFFDAPWSHDRTSMRYSLCQTIKPLTSSFNKILLSWRQSWQKNNTLVKPWKFFSRCLSRLFGQFSITCKSCFITTSMFSHGSKQFWNTVEHFYLNLVKFSVLTGHTMQICTTAGQTHEGMVSISFFGRSLHQFTISWWKE